jgi:hypothetical protein
VPWGHLGTPGDTCPHLMFIDHDAGCAPEARDLDLTRSGPARKDGVGCPQVSPVSPKNFETQNLWLMEFEEKEGGE